MAGCAGKHGETGGLAQSQRQLRVALVLNAFIWLVPLVGGCTASRSVFSRGPNELLEAAREVRQAPAPPLPRELAKHVLPSYTVEPGDVLLVLPTEVDLPGQEMGSPQDKPAPADKKKDEDQEAEKLPPPKEGTPAEKTPVSEKVPAPDRTPPPTIHIPADQPILPDGSINLGRYGRLIVSGKTVEEIEAMIRGTVALQIGRDPGFITVRIVTRDSKVYYVLGEVNSPGAFQLKGRETVLDAILAAGGLNERASRQNILLSRPTPPDSCRLVLPVCYREIVQLGDTTTNYQIAPGDRVFVPSRTHRELMHPGKFGCGLCERKHVPCPLGHEGANLPPIPGKLEGERPGGEASPLAARLSSSGR